MGLTKFDKFLIALVGAAAQVVQAYFGGNADVQVGIAVLTALGVYAGKNKI
jgi:hypothetical protein